MVFWKKNDDDDGGENAAITSVIGQDMQLVGDVSFKGKLRLDGRVKGNVRGDYLIMGESGVVVGDVLVNNFVCSGRVEGNVNVKKLHISASGAIDGKVEATDLTVESGAAISGEVKSRSKELRLVPGSSIPKEEWDAQVQEAATYANTGKRAKADKADNAQQPQPQAAARKQAAATG